MITVKKATVKDLEDVLALYKKLLDYEAVFTNEFKKGWEYSKKGRAFFESRLKGYNSFTLLAEKEGKLVGFAMTHISKAMARQRIKLATLEYLYTEENMRKKGIGTMLLEEVKKILRNKNVPRLRLTTFLENSNAINFYKDHEFKEFTLNMETDL